MRFQNSVAVDVSRRNLKQMSPTDVGGYQVSNESLRLGFQLGRSPRQPVIPARRFAEITRRQYQCVIGAFAIAIEDVLRDLTRRGPQAYCGVKSRIDAVTREDQQVARREGQQAGVQ